VSISRRNFLRGAGAAGAGMVGSTFFPGLARAASISATSGASLDDIEHIVILMQENRSFDEYFGTMSDVAGFSDPDALAGVFMQAGGLRSDGLVAPYTLPWWMDTATTDAQTTYGLSHAWDAQHLAWAEGAMTGFLAAQEEEPVTMGYFKQQDIPYQWALANFWTICDQYHCSVLGPTNPNRIVSMSGTIDPAGTMGGPVVDNSSTNGQLMWTTVPEQLQGLGVNWYVYQEDDNYGDNMLPFFAAYQDTKTDLYRRANSFIPSMTLLGQATAAQLASDVQGGRLPQVSWIIGAAETTEHPDYSPGRGAQFIDQILTVWSSGSGDLGPRRVVQDPVHPQLRRERRSLRHVVPPTQPDANDTQEWVYSPVGDTPPVPYGLGFRVPCTLISPFTVGPLVSHDVFDHTSVIKLLETKYGFTCPNISTRRRANTGHLINAINLPARRRPPCRPTCPTPTSWRPTPPASRRCRRPTPRRSPPGRSCRPRTPPRRGAPRAARWLLSPRRPPCPSRACQRSCPWWLPPASGSSPCVPAGSGRPGRMVTTWRSTTRGRTAPRPACSRQWVATPPARRTSTIR
jgi:phospholipase C